MCKDIWRHAGYARIYGNQHGNNNTRGAISETLTNY